MRHTKASRGGTWRGVLPLLVIVFLGTVASVMPLEIFWPKRNPAFEALADAVILIVTITPFIVLIESTRRRAEERARYLSAVVDHAQDAVFGQAPDGSVTTWNAGAEALTGYPAAEVIGGPPNRFVAPEFHERLQPLLRRVRQGEFVPPYESAVVRKDGTRIPTLVSLAAVRAENGSVTGMAVIIRDISELKKLHGEQERLIVELRQALADVRRLSGMLPICAKCKRIRDDQGYWTEVEAFFRERTEAEFSHGMCPVCARELYGEYIDDKPGSPPA
jgi:PAS domain S-box-containing protein